MMNRVERIKAKLEAAFQPSMLEIEDESRRHANHAGRQGLPAGETHYKVAMV
ncbi:MAG: BolA/IbaG family iron-sulfur metabolism protein, partial [Rhodospirillales bacterium]|nr:BolA/IbaG family iron-sulfur metabolism protein [Rhodospirillales bacterium]